MRPAGTTTDEMAGAKLPITETRIVELTAKWLALAGKLKQGAMRQVLAKDGAKPDEIRLFLEIVGDLSDGSPDVVTP